MVFIPTMAKPSAASGMRATARSDSTFSSPGEIIKWLTQTMTALLSFTLVLSFWPGFTELNTVG